MTKHYPKTLLVGHYMGQGPAAGCCRATLLLFLEYLAAAFRFWF